MKFKSEPDENTRQTLKSLGLKWNSLRDEWERYADVGELKALLKNHEVTITKVN